MSTLLKPVVMAVRMSADMYEDLRTVANEEQESMAAIVRTACKRYLRSRKIGGRTAEAQHEERPLPDWIDVR